MDTERFFNGVREAVFGGSLKQSQVDGLNLIIAEADRRGIKNEYLSYILATAAHETGYTMEPIREWGKGKGRKYGRPDPKTGQVYYGRGFVQLTWLFNYEKATRKLGVDFVNNPDLVMVPEHAVSILFDGMLEGWFTGKSLSDYLDGVDEDDQEDLREFSNARRIINGTDRQVAIGKLALKFEKALRDSGRPEDGSPVVKSPATPDARPGAPVSDPEGPKQGLLSRILVAIVRAIIDTLRGTK